MTAELDETGSTGTVLSAYVLAMSVLALDQLTKLMVEYYLRTPGRRIPVIPNLDFFNLVYVQNPGAAWGILPGYRWLFVAATVLSGGICLAVIHAYDSIHQRIPFALILGGAMGNLIDRLLVAEGVVDFLDFGLYSYRWPAFNVADSALTVAVLWLCMSLLNEFYSEVGSG